MITHTENGLVDLAIGWIKANKLVNSSGDVPITEETNLFETGVLDSFGFVELLLFLENQCGCKIDLTDVEPAEFSIVKGLCRIALGNQR